MDTRDERQRPVDRIAYSIKSAAEAIDVSYKTLHRMMRAGQIGYVLVPTGSKDHLSKRIRREDIDAWIRSGKPKPPI